MKQWTLRKVSWPIFWSSLAGVSDNLDFGSFKHYSEIIPAGVFLVVIFILFWKLNFHSLVYQNNSNSLSYVLQYLIASDVIVLLVEVTKLSALL